MARENKMGPYKSFETERLILRPTSEEDAEFILELVNTPKWLRYIGDRNIRSAENARDFIKAKILPQLERLGYANYTLIRKADNRKIGTCGLSDRDGLEGIDIGFACLPEFERQGYSFEAANRLIQVAFDEFGLNELKAMTIEENIASQRLLEKLGFTLRGRIQLPLYLDEMLLYVIKKQDLV